MILYFTGTGNSRYLARLLGQKLGDELVSAAQMIKENRRGDFRSDKPWVFVCPTYGWRIPRIFEHFIRESSFIGSNKAYFIMNCGSEIGNAEKGIRVLCNRMNFHFQGVMQIKMPENYIAMFSAPDEEEAAAIIQRAAVRAEEAAEYILTGREFPGMKASLLDRLYSGVINDGFYKFCIGDKRFYSTDKCVSCGRCVESCMLNNISLENGRPVWHGSCTHCMACISRCPTEAIEYGKHSVGLRRYYLD